MAGPEGKPVSGSRNGLGQVRGHSHLLHCGGPCVQGHPCPVAACGAWLPRSKRTCLMAVCAHRPVCAVHEGQFMGTG